MSSNCTIAANPDIAGVGVRAALYVQALLAVIPPALALWVSNPVPKQNTRDTGGIDVEIDEDTSVDLYVNTLTALLTGGALLVSAWIQSSLYGLSIYHALIVFNLSWLNNVTAMLSILIKMFTTRTFGSLTGDLFVVECIAYLAHFTMTGIFGIWLFKDVNGFGMDPLCNFDVNYYVFGFPVSATANAFRILGLLVSSVALVPLLNMVILMGTVLVPGALLSAFTACFSDADKPKQLEVMFLLCSTGLIIFLIVATEGTVGYNRSLVGEGEGDWTFGQTLALIVLVIPVFNTLGKIQEASKKRARDKGDSYAPLGDGEPGMAGNEGGMDGAETRDVRFRRAQREEAARFPHHGLLEMLG